MKRPTKHSLIGKWRIIEMELWDKDFLDMMEPVYIAFDGKAARHRHRFCNRRSSVCPLFLRPPALPPARTSSSLLSSRPLAEAKPRRSGTVLISHTRTCGISSALFTERQI